MAGGGHRGPARGPARGWFCSREWALAQLMRGRHGEWSVGPEIFEAAECRGSYGPCQDRARSAVVVAPSPHGGGRWFESGQPSPASLRKPAPTSRRRSSCCSECSVRAASPELPEKHRAPSSIEPGQRGGTDSGPRPESRARAIDGRPARVRGDGPRVPGPGGVHTSLRRTTYPRQRRTHPPVFDGVFWPTRTVSGGTTFGLWG